MHMLKISVAMVAEVTGRSEAYEITCADDEKTQAVCHTMRAAARGPSASA